MERIPLDRSPPLPVRRRRHLRLPLEERANWDPWLPATEAYPEVPDFLRAVAIGVLLLMALAVLIVVLASL
jgi:hypothetical protein